VGCLARARAWAAPRGSASHLAHHRDGTHDIHPLTPRVDFISYISWLFIFTTAGLIPEQCKILLGVISLLPPLLTLAGQTPQLPYIKGRSSAEKLGA
jgi:hypothetical protein